MKFSETKSYFDDHSNRPIDCGICGNLNENLNDNLNDYVPDNDSWGWDDTLNVLDR